MVGYMGDPFDTIENKMFYSYFEIFFFNFFNKDTAINVQFLSWLLSIR